MLRIWYSFQYEHGSFFLADKSSAVDKRGATVGRVNQIRQQKPFIFIPQVCGGLPTSRLIQMGGTAEPVWPCWTASLPESPSADGIVLRGLDMHLSCGHLDDKDMRTTFAEQVVSDIWASLVGNTTLNAICIETIDDSWEQKYFDSDILLCDVSSIESISNSNHTLQYISVSGHNISTLADHCLLIDMTVDKANRIRHKILQYYFAGKFYVSPCVHLPLSVLPQIIAKSKDSKSSLQCIGCCSAYQNCVMFQTEHHLKMSGENISQCIVRIMLIINVLAAYYFVQYGSVHFAHCVSVHIG
jgi:hypothetical protein